MGNPGSAVATRRDAAHAGHIPGYERLDGPVPVSHPPRLAGMARETRDHLALGSRALEQISVAEAPGVEALLVAEEDRDSAPRENARPYPPGLPYFTRSVDPPALVLPEDLSPVFRPRTPLLWPLAVWHELAHAFLLQREVVKMPAWLGELVPQAASAAVARRAGLPLDEHLGLINRDPGFTVREFGGRASAQEQMDYQNLLLVFGAAAVDEFGEGSVGFLIRALWNEDDVVDEERAEELLAGSLGSGGAAWLSSRPEF